MFSNIFQTFANCFKIPELKSRILFTLALLAVARVLADAQRLGATHIGFTGIDQYN